MPLDHRTPAYPGDQKIKIEPIALLGKDGWNEKRIHCNSHCGTHIDAPAHFVKNGKTIDKIELNNFLGKGILIDVRKKKIDLNCLKGIKITPKSVVLFLTGQSDKRHAQYYSGAQFMSEEVAKKLAAHKVKAVGIDSFSPDTEPYPVHKIFLPKGILIIENLINVKKLVGKKFSVQYFPLRIIKGDGSPCRAIAMVN